VSGSGRVMLPGQNSWSAPTRDTVGSGSSFVIIIFGLGRVESS
jgi:hypothetical protein